MASVKSGPHGGWEEEGERMMLELLLISCLVGKLNLQRLQNKEGNSGTPNIATSQAYKCTPTPSTK